MPSDTTIAPHPSHLSHLSVADYTVKTLMNAVWHRFLKPFYRKEPVSSFILTVGAVDVALGGLGSYSSLLLLGMGTMTGAIALRWWQSQRADKHRPQESLPEYYLAPGVSSQPLPRLNPSKHRR